MSNYCLWLDDLRPTPKTVHQWRTAKDLESFRDIIRTHGVPKYISFDHDLNEKHYNGDYSDKKTGLDVIEWLLKYCANENEEFPMFSIHTMNYTRGQEMKQLLLVSAGSDRYVPCWTDYDKQAE